MLNRLEVRMTAFFLAVTAIVFMPLWALAEDTVSAAPPMLGDPTDVQAMAKLVLDAVMNKQWGLLASLAVLITVSSLRKYVPEHTKVGLWFRTKLGGIISAFAVSLSGAFATLFLAGGVFSLDMVLKALSVALGASGGWSIWKNVREALDEKKAQEAGTDAAAAPKDTLNS